MNLADASRYFDRTEVTDLVTGKLLFKCQIDPYDDSRRDSASAYRRIMSVAPGTAVPAARAATIMGKTWIIGGFETDGLDDLHRDKYVIQAATTSLKISRLGDFLSGTVAATVPATPNWVKDAKQLEVSSDTPQIFDITLPEGSDARMDDVLWNAGSAFLVLSPRPMASGMRIANCLALDQITPLQAIVAGRTYNPALGAYGAAVNVSVNALKVRWQSLFKYGSQMSERYQEGDVSIVLPLGTVINTSSRITMGGVNYQVLALLDVVGAVVAHARVA